MSQLSDDDDFADDLARYNDAIEQLVQRLADVQVALDALTKNMASSVEAVTRARDDLAVALQALHDHRVVLERYQRRGTM